MEYDCLEAKDAEEARQSEAAAAAIAEQALSGMLRLRTSSMFGLHSRYFTI